MKRGRRLKQRDVTQLVTSGRVERPPIRRPDSYEYQLLPAERARLKSRLMEGGINLSLIATKSPKWRTGPFAGKRPTIQTLLNLRQRFQLEQDFEDDQQTTEALLEELRREVPGVSPEQLAVLGQRTFSLLALRQKDVNAWVALQRTQVALDDVRLSAEKFRRETCELFLKWSEDNRAREIAAGGSSNADKIEALGRLMFAETWDEPSKAKK
jgi:hypothetical protein